MALALAPWTGLQRKVWGGLPTSHWGLELDASLTYGASQSFSYRESFLFIHNHGILQGVFDRELSKKS